MFNRVLDWITSDRTQLINITDRINEIVRKSGVRDGIVHLQSLHTTTAVFLNEWQDALVHDVKRFLEDVVARETDWRHNDPQHSDCERKNADSHLRGMMMGQNALAPGPQFQRPARHLAEHHPAEFDGRAAGRCRSRFPAFNVENAEAIHAIRSRTSFYPKLRKSSRSRFAQGPVPGRRAGDSNPSRSAWPCRAASLSTATRCCDSAPSAIGAESA